MIAAPPPVYTPVSSVGVAGVVSFPSWSKVRDIDVLFDGSALVLLDRLNTGGVTIASTVTRLRADGSVVAGFASGAATPGFVDLVTTSGSLVPMADGSFFVAGRRFRADGVLDTGYGVNGSMSSNGVAIAVGPAELVELRGGRVAVIREALGYGCVIEVIEADGTIGPIVPTGARCTEAVHVPLPDGRRVVLVHELFAGYRLLFLTPDGALDTTVGGDGVLDVDAGLGPTPRLIDAVPTGDGGILVLPQSQALSSVYVARLGPDGLLDPAFGVGGISTFVGFTSTSMSVNAAGAPLVGVQWRPQPTKGFTAQPAYAQLTPTGQVDGEFNRDGRDRGWLDVTELGVTNPALPGPQAMLDAGHLMIGLATAPTRESPYVAAVMVLRSSTAPVTSIGGAAQATRGAVRLDVGARIPLTP